MAAPVKNRRFSAGVWLGLLLAAGLFGYFLVDVDWPLLAESLAGVKPLPVLGAILLVLSEFFMRAFRWRILLKPVAPKASRWDLLMAILIGAAANTLLPARAGEIAKPLVASRKLGVPFAAVLATAVMERVYDIFGLICVLVTMVIVLPHQPGDGSAHDAVLVYKLKLYGGAFGLVALSCMVVFFVLASRGQQAGRVFRKITALAPDPVAKPFDQLFDGFVVGLGSARDLGGMARAAGISAVIWFNGALAIYLLFYAFGFELSFGAACFTAVAIALAVVLPQAPGFLGVFQVAMEQTMLLWSVEPTGAKAFAMLFWAVSFIPVTTLGLLALWREGLSLREIWSTEREPLIPPPDAVA